MKWQIKQVLVKVMISFLVLLQLTLQTPLNNQIQRVKLSKPVSIEKISLQKLDPRDLAYLIKILEVEQFQRYKR